MAMMRESFRSLLRWLDSKIEFWLVFLFYTYMTVIIIVEVFRRYVLGASSTWGEETAIYAFIWMTYIAAAHRVKGRKHLSVEMLRNRMNRNQRFCAFVLSDLCFFILAVAVIYYSITYVGTNIEYGQNMLGVDLPMALASVGVPIGWGLIAFRVIQRFMSTLRRFQMGQPLVEDEMVRFE